MSDLLRYLFWQFCICNWGFFCIPSSLFGYCFGALGYRSGIGQIGCAIYASVFTILVIHVHTPKVCHVCCLMLHHVFRLSMTAHVGQATNLAPRLWRFLTDSHTNQLLKLVGWFADLLTNLTYEWHLLVQPLVVFLRCYQDQGLESWCQGVPTCLVSYSKSGKEHNSDKWFAIP